MHLGYNHDTPWWQVLEEIRENFQTKLDEKTSKLEKNIKGQHPTRFDLSKKILSLVFESYYDINRENIRFLEPAVGLGAFYSAFLHLSKGSIPTYALGVEKYEELAGPASAIWEEAGLDIVLDDFTQLRTPEDESDKFNLIITNPPYIRHHHIEKEDKLRLPNQVLNTLGLKTNGLMGLYGYFLLLSHNWMQKNGIGVWLIPREFFDVNYGAVLKKYLTEKVELLRIHCFDVDDVQFDRAEVTSVIVIFKNSPPKETIRPLFSFGTLECPKKEVFIPINLLKKIKKWSSIERKNIDDLMNKETNLENLKIGDLFQVKRGFATGNKDFFIMTLDEAKNRNIPVQFLTPTLPISRYLLDSVINSDENGMPLTSPVLFYLNCDSPKNVLKIEFPALYDYILKGENKGIHKGHLASRRRPWYKQEKRSPAPILCAYAGRKSKKGESIRFYRNKSQAVATNAYYNLYPNLSVIAEIPDLEEFYNVVFNILQNLRQSEILIEGRSYGGGFNKIEPKELEQVVLDNIPDKLKSLKRI